jgi:glycyl-tRNA synthetase beta chain
MPADLLFEIGTEEIPAGFLIRALGDLERLATAKLDEARLGHGAVRALGTPRRLTLIVSEVAERQPDLSERVVGPPARVAFDDEGKPTKAAIGFAKKNGVELDALERAEVEGRKGEYVVCTREEPGQPAVEVLAPMLEALIAEIPWPKSMRWSSKESAFVRPVHWMVAVIGDATLPVSFAGIDAGASSRGHRFLAPEPVEVDASSYIEMLRKAFVIVDPADRRNMIVAELARIEEETGKKVRPDEELLDEVSYLVEYPVAVCGEFDPSYLEVPAEVIVTAMRSHQRYFAMQEADGSLCNRFVTIAGTVTRKAEVVRAGNERVLAARLADASYFFRQDQRSSLDAMAEKLHDVVFQNKLGTIGAKVERFTLGTDDLADALGLPSAHAHRAAQLCKADLVSSMVYEFPELQGIMGSHYARGGGEPGEVALAISEHYLPRGSGDDLPSADEGALVGIADRMDTIVGCFAAGLAPTGSADPFALRRAALGVLAILLDRGWTVSLETLVDNAAKHLKETLDVTAEHREQVLEFFRTRLRGVLVDGASLPADCVEAALTAGFDDVPDARARAEAVAKLRSREDFEPLATAFKRVANILKGASSDGAPDPERFAEDEERALWQAFRDIESRAADKLQGGDYDGSLQVLAELKGPVDAFFDKVLVMDKDEAIKQNRLALLGSINATFTRIADFRQLAV